MGENALSDGVRFRLTAPPAGYWIIGPLEAPMGETRLPTRHRPSWRVRWFARWFLDSRWVAEPALTS